MEASAERPRACEPSGFTSDPHKLSLVATLLRGKE
jgi:hypothetical protein